MCDGSPKGIVAGVCMMCLAYSSVPLRMQLEEHWNSDNDEIAVDPHYLHKVLFALDAFESEIKLLRSQLSDACDSSDPFPTVGGKEEKP
jgi:hypothetical protein